MKEATDPPRALGGVVKHMEGRLRCQRKTSTALCQANAPQHDAEGVNPIPVLISASGYEPAMCDLEVDLQVAPGEICQSLKIPESEYLQTARVLLRPVVFVTYYLSPKSRGEAMNWNEFRGSMGSFIEYSPNTRIHQSHARISAGAAAEAVAQKLEVQEGRFSKLLPWAIRRTLSPPD